MRRAELKNGTRYGLILGLVFSLFIACKPADQEKDIIAQVGNETLTLRKLSDQIPLQLQSTLKESEIKEYVVRWINKEILYQEALSLKLDERADFQYELERMEKELLVNKLLEVLIDSKPVSVSDAEIQGVYDESTEEFILNEDVVHCFHILCETREQADGIRSQLSQGVLFEHVVLGSNADSIKFENWDLGYFSRTEILSDIAKVAFSLPVGAFSNPIKTEHGFHILQVVDKRAKGQKKDLTQVKDEIRMKLAELKRQENYERFLVQTKNKYPIQSNFQLLDSITKDSIVSKGETNSEK
jgi:parvulin-like peptidyl-prolyl isomerase